MNLFIFFELGVFAQNVRDLYSNILENYNSLSPPDTGSLDLDRRTIIDVGVDLIWINEIDPAATKYDALIFWELTWHDDRLTWEGIDFLESSDIRTVFFLVRDQVQSDSHNLSIQKT